MNNSPIGVFDSGMGGLTVLRALTEQLPNESFIYLGDTARLPYGTKSQTTVKQYATQMASILVRSGIKLLVIACNTATTAALSHLQQLFPDLPIIGVVEPGAQAAVRTTQKKHIALLATETTVNSGIYQKTIHDYRPDIMVLSQSCGLLVSLAEEGWMNDGIAISVLKKYLTPITQHPSPPDCAILGCTHFPVFKHIISDFLGEHVRIIDSAKETALAVEAMLKKHNLMQTIAQPTLRFLVTDLPERFAKVGKIFFGRPIQPADITLIDGTDH